MARGPWLFVAKQGGIEPEQTHLYSDKTAIRAVLKA